jgi:hypothetical protein
MSIGILTEKLFNDAHNRVRKIFGSDRSSGWSSNSIPFDLKVSFPRFAGLGG